MNYVCHCCRAVELGLSRITLKFTRLKMMIFFEAYRFIFPGYNVRPIEMSGAIGIEQLKKLDQMIRQRRKNAALFTKLFTNDERFIVQRENGMSSWFSFTVILNPQLNQNRIAILVTLKQAGIEHRIITGGNFLRYDVIQHINHEIVGDIKNANIAHDYGFLVGNHPYDLSKDINYFHSVISRVTEK